MSLSDSLLRESRSFFFFNFFLFAAAAFLLSSSPLEDLNPGLASSDKCADSGAGAGAGGAGAGGDAALELLLLSSEFFLESVRGSNKDETSY